MKKLMAMLLLAGSIQGIYAQKTEKKEMFLEIKGLKKGFGFGVALQRIERVSLDDDQRRRVEEGDAPHQAARLRAERDALPVAARQEIGTAIAAHLLRFLHGHFG